MLLPTPHCALFGATCGVPRYGAAPPLFRRVFVGTCLWHVWVGISVLRLRARGTSLHSSCVLFRYGAAPPPQTARFLALRVGFLATARLRRFLACICRVVPLARVGGNQHVTPTCQRHVPTFPLRSFFAAARLRRFLACICRDVPLARVLKISVLSSTCQRHVPTGRVGGGSRSSRSGCR